MGGLVCAALLVALPAVASAKMDKNAGIAAGDPTSDAIIVWARATKSGKVTAQVSTSKGFSRSKTKSKNVNASSSKDFTVQVEFKRLKAGTRYYYRFKQGSSKSGKGQFKTLPRKSKASAFKLTFTGDSDGHRVGGNPVFNNFESLDAARREKSDLFVYLGDTIYSDGTVVCPATFLGSTVCTGKTSPQSVSFPVARTVAEKWAKYKENRGYQHLRNFLGSLASVTNWDDHEVINDFDRDYINSTPANRALFAAGLQAFRNYFPIRKYSANSTGFYRNFKAGKNVEMWVLDERSFRDAEANDTAICDNPPGTPDLAPTAPQSTRGAFSAIAASLLNPVPPACLAKFNQPGRSMLGTTQLNAFKSSLKASTAKWKLIFTGDPIQQLYAAPYDRWEGYPKERADLLKHIKDSGIKNVVWLATDQHDSVLGPVRNCTLGGPVEGPCPSAGSPTGMHELITGGIATNSFSKEIQGATGSTSAGGLVQGIFYVPPPPNGLGTECAQLDKYSYALVTINKSGSQLTMASKDQSGQVVKDPTTGKPCSKTLTAQ